jgi:hypothetical protein
MTNFAQAADRVLGRMPGVVVSSPAQLLERWRAFVEECLRGYPYDWYEFVNELAVRDTIEVLLEDATLRTFPEWLTWSARVSEADSQYRTILGPSISVGATSGWWRRQVPRYAGPILVADLAANQGVSLEDAP